MYKLKSIHLKQNQKQITHESNKIYILQTGRKSLRKFKKNKNIFIIVTEAVVQRCSVKMVFLEISQDSQENTCARDSDLINFIKKESLAQVFSSEFCEIFRNTFLQNTSGGCFWRVSSSQQKLRLPSLQELGSPCWIYFCITSFLFYFSFFSSSIPFFYFYVIFPICCKSQLCPCDFDKLNSFNLGKRNYLPQCFSVGFAYENLFVD